MLARINPTSQILKHARPENGVIIYMCMREEGSRAGEVGSEEIET